METTLGLLGGGSSGGNESNSTVAKSEVANKEYPPEAELELGLGLSLGGGGGGRVKPCKPCAWGEYRRILTAKDFPSVVSQDDSSAISGFNRANGSAGTKRSADTAAQEVSSATAVRLDCLLCRTDPFYIFLFFYLLYFNFLCLFYKAIWIYQHTHDQLEIEERYLRTMNNWNLTATAAID